MFKRCSVKTLAQLRASERKKYLNQAKSIYGNEGWVDDDVFPKDMQAGKAICKDGARVKVMVAGKDPVWFTVEVGQDEHVVPTMYTLWKVPSILPVVRVGAPVTEALMNGADLMVPGVLPIEQETRFLDARAGDWVAVVQVGETLPVAVGRLAMHGQQLMQETQGKAVYIMHMYQDALWAMGSKSHPVESLESVSVELVELAEPVKVEETVPVVPVEQVDDELRGALLQALKTKVDPTSMPMPMSTFYSGYILPCRHMGSTVDVKASSWKKTHKFLSAMEKLGYIKLKKVQQDVVVFSVNAMHPHVQQHVDYKTLQDKADQAKEATVKEVHVQGIIVQDVYKPLNTLTEVFKETKSAKQLYTASELKAILNEYIQLHQLADSHDPRNVRLDARLFHGVLNKEERAKNIEVMTRPELVKRFVDCMHSMYWIHLPGSIEPTLRKGKIKPIEIKVETRRGRKQITLINHVDVFGLDVSVMSTELATLCAGSVSVGETLAKTVQVVVQGDHVSKIVPYLHSKGVHKNHIVVLK